ncbi:MAG: hypothetical protein ACQKBV_05150 [Puniceicoccales bacterium]
MKPILCRSVLALALGALLNVSVAFAQPAEIPTPYTYAHDIPPRLQWNENNGYCGETSFISAGLNFGQYCSQFTARSIASPGIPQYDESAQLLLGVNDTYAAQRMRLDADEFYYETQTRSLDFMDWVKSNTLAGNVVIIGVFNNGIILGEWTQRTDGDPEYDHIVPVLEFGSRVPFSQTRNEYSPGDVITISDNGLYGPFGNPPEYQFYYAYRYFHFLGSRRMANRPNGPVYLLKNRPANYGIAIKGVLDLDEVTIPVRLVASRNSEPQIDHHSNTAPVPEPLTLTATVSIPNQRRAYNLYLYDDFDKTPVANFNALAGNAVDSWVIPANSGDTFEVVINTMTDQTVIFRAVPANAP